MSIIGAASSLDRDGAGAASQQRLSDDRVLPSQVKERLTGYPIRGTRIGNLSGG